MEADRQMDGYLCCRTEQQVPSWFLETIVAFAVNDDIIEGFSISRLLLRLLLFTSNISICGCIRRGGCVFAFCSFVGSFTFLMLRCAVENDAVWIFCFCLHQEHENGVLIN